MQSRYQLILAVLFFFGMNLSSQAQEVTSMTAQEFLERVEGMEEEVTVINFWATWCGPCVEELPYFNQMAQTYSEEGVTTIFVSLDFKEAALKTFMEAHDFEGEVIFLTDGLRDPDWIGQLEDSWSGAIPATLAIKEELRSFHEGSFTYEELVTWLRPAFISGN